MGKGGLFVLLYSVILVSLFITFSYLMMTVNPPPLKDQENSPGNMTGLDDILYADEVLLPSDDFQYGLDKSPIGYRVVDINLTSYRSALVNDNKHDSGENLNSNVRKVVPPVWPDESSTLTTRVISLTTFANTKMPVKGFRRSINDGNKKTLRQNVPRLLFLKIINEDGQPRIDIKLASDDIVNKNTKKYKSFENKQMPGTDSIPISINNITANLNVSNHDYKWSVIKMEENKTLVLNLNENLNENESVINLFNESEISIIHRDDKQTELFDETINVTNNSNFSTLSENLTHTVGETTLNFETFKLNFLNKNVTKIENNTANYLSAINSNDKKTPAVNNESHSTESYKKVTKLSKNISETQTQAPEVHYTKKTIDKINNEPYHYKSTGNLIGLMIPEATATLPFNYHFIDGNDKNIFSNVMKSKMRSKRD